MEIKIMVMGLLTAFGLVIISWQLGKISAEVNALKKHMGQEIDIQNQWLFKQLYAMAPGKVLAPDEVEEKGEVVAKAEVYSPTKDPMSEFNGKKNDWHG